MMFKDRTDAALQIAARLQHYKDQRALVLAIPRGGVPMGKIVADAIGGELDVVLVHKLGHPHNPEFAVGAVDEDGNTYFDGFVPPVDTNHQLERLKALRKKYTPLKKRIDPAGRLIIIVDDGIATGWTVKAAIALLRRAKALRIVVAIAVAPEDTCLEIRDLADEVICLETATYFQAVSAFYQDFSQVSDEEVERILVADA